MLSYNVAKIMFSLVENHLKITYFGVFAHFGGIVKYFLRPISGLEYVINSKVMVVLNSANQAPSISGIITLL